MHMKWIYLSPHFDDAALSCGGLIWEQAQRGLSVAVWTICGGRFPDGPLTPFAKELKERWQTSQALLGEKKADIDDDVVELRRAEDIEACQQLGASYRHFEIPDCIYRFIDTSSGEREYLYRSVAEFTGPMHRCDSELIDDLAGQLASEIPGRTQLVCPLGLGNHVDHQLTRLAAEKLGRGLLYYADFPYTRKNSQQLEKLIDYGWHFKTLPISVPGLQAWQVSVAAYLSQITSFWPDLDTMRNDLREYCSKNGGVRLWAPTRESKKR